MKIKCVFEVTQKLRIAMAFLCCLAFQPIVHAVAFITTPASIREYDPFTARVTFNTAYCLSDTYPIFGEVDLKGNVLSVVLTHVKTGPCVASRDVRIPGLPGGQYTLRISVSKVNDDRSIPAGIPGGVPGGFSTLAETVEASILVSTSTTLRSFWTARVDGNEFEDIYETGRIPYAGPVTLYFSGLRGGIFGLPQDWLEVGLPSGTAYAFKALGAFRANLQSALTPLFALKYPSPYKGSFFTADRAVAERLTREWTGKPLVDEGDAVFAVGKLIAGACPLGMSPVYQAFHPTEVAHRWTQSRVTYAMLLNVGYAGDGPVWCAPALRGE